MLHAHGGVAKTQAIHRTGREVVHEDVGARNQLCDDFSCFGALQVERERFLRPIEPDEITRQAFHARVVPACEIAGARSLNFDNARAPVGEMARGEGRRDGLLDGDDGEAGEGEGGFVSHAT